MSKFHPSFPLNPTPQATKSARKKQHNQKPHVLKRVGSSIRVDRLLLLFLTLLQTQGRGLQHAPCNCLHKHIIRGSRVLMYNPNSKSTYSLLRGLRGDL